MTDWITKKLSITLRGSGLVHEPMGYRMPTSTEEAAKRYLHQVKLFPIVSRRGNDLMIQIKLHPSERDKGSEEIKDVDDVFAGYLNGGQFVFTRGWGRVSFIRSTDKAAMWPERYALRALFEEKHLASFEAVKARLKEAKKALKGRGTVIELRLSKIIEAMETGHRVNHKKTDGRTANLYEAFAGPEGPELWVARLPSLRRDDRPDREHFIEVHPDRNGAAARLTAGFLSNLLAVLHMDEDPEKDTGVVKDGIDFASSYYLFQSPTQLNEDQEGEVEESESEDEEERDTDPPESDEEEDENN